MAQEWTPNLLWPESTVGKPSPHRREELPFMRDLGIDSIVAHAYTKLRLVAFAEELFSNLCQDTAVIQYRLDIMEDLLAVPTLTKAFAGLLPQLSALTEQRRRQPHVKNTHTFQRIAWRLDVLNGTVDCIERLHTALSAVQSQLRSHGLRSLLDYVAAIKESSEYQALTSEMPRLLHNLERVSSITIGVNMSGDLRAVEATILSVDSKPFKERPLFSRLFGLATEDEAYQGIGAFHSVFKGRPGLTALEQMMFDDLNEIIHEAVKPIDKALSRYTRDQGQFLIHLEPALKFYLGAVDLIRQLQDAGLPMCKPEVAQVEERVCQIEGLYDVNLALELLQHDTDLGERIVLNDIDFGPEGRIFILTGPNQGGKTTYTRAIGVAQVLFQVGMYVPGHKARISPVEWIHTHFLEDEIPNSQEGKLAEECRRLATIFERATPYSLILLNESLSSTSPGESLYLTEGVVKGLRMTGCRAVFATHLHELAARVDTINSQTPGDSAVISMVAGLEPEHEEVGGTSFRKRSYRVTPGPPQGSSFALDIARRYGISIEQIVERLETRRAATAAGI